MLLSPGSSVNDHIKVCFLDMNFEGIGFPELHTLPDLLATRTRVAQAEGLCWRGCTAATPAQTLLLCSRAAPCEYNGRNGDTKSPGASQVSIGFPPGPGDVIHSN